MKGRIAENPHLFGVFMPELQMAKKLYDAALELQHILNCTGTFDDHDSESYPPELKALLDSVYRPLRRAVDFYYGDDNPLTYVAPPPGRPFKAAK